MTFTIFALPSGVAANWTFWIYPGAAESEGAGKIDLKEYNVESTYKNILSTNFSRFLLCFL